MKTSDNNLRDHVVYLLNGGGAHMSVEQALEGLPAHLRGARPDGLLYSPWRLLEHIRTCLWDILEFSRNPEHKSPPWPEGYWPEGDVPPNESAWQTCLDSLRHDLKAMVDLVINPTTDLFERIPWGDGQTLLREALLVADHNAYHVGQLVAVRTLLGAEADE